MPNCGVEGQFQIAFVVGPTRRILPQQGGGREKYFRTHLLSGAMACLPTQHSEQPAEFLVRPGAFPNSLIPLRRKGQRGSGDSAGRWQ